jgi:hypothetical protein
VCVCVCAGGARACVRARAFPSVFGRCAWHLAARSLSLPFAPCSLPSATFRYLFAPFSILFAPFRSLSLFRSLASGCRLSLRAARRRCVFLSTSRGHTLHLWDAYTGQLRTSYRACVERALSVH